jgi:hypothetical protein
MMSVFRQRFGLIGVGIIALFALTFGPSAMAAGVGKSGSCSADSQWTFSATLDGRGIWVELALDSGFEGQIWRFRIIHDGVRVSRGTMTIQPDGTTQVGTLMRNHRGIDRLRFHTGTQSTGETCHGGLRL